MNNNDLYDELRQLIEEKLITLPDKPEESAHASICALWHLAAGNPMAVESAFQVELPDLTESQIIDLRVYVDKRLAGVPLAHLTHRQQFMGVEFIVGSDALVPRKETELLGYAALEIVDHILSEHTTARVLDICTGSGNLALAIAKKRPNIEVFGADLSSDAVNLAKRNAVHLGLDSWVKFCVSDLLESYESSAFYNSIDLLTCNPPYISSGKLESMPGEIIEYEPSMAFDGGPFGIKILSKLIHEAPKYLNKNGWLAFEVGLGQGGPMLRQLERNKDYKKLKAIKNENGEIRAIVAQANH
jgi:release factor glutamine methyltransferase